MEAETKMPSLHPASLWAATAPPVPDLPRLEGAATADVVVVGGGFSGLSTALHLREAGCDVAVLEAMDVGFGASGRNNGQVIPTLTRPDPDDMVARFGPEAGERFVALVRDWQPLCSIWRAATASPAMPSRPAGSSRRILPAACA